MSVWDSMRAWAVIVRQRQQAENVKPQSSQGGIGGFIGSVVAGLNHLLTGPLGGFVTAETDWAKLVIWWDRTVAAGYGKVAAWLINGILAGLKSLIGKLFARLRGELAALKRQLIADDIYGLRLAMAYADKDTRAEAKARRAADIRLDLEIKTRIKWLHQQIEREAVSAYRGQAGQQNAIITRLLDLVVNLNPVLRPLVSDVIKGILDLAAVDDPIARIALGFALREVIDRLGLDKPIGDLIRGLLASVLGQGKPHGIHDVIADMCSRIAAGEQQWTRFYADGGSEVEQAGEQWQALTRWTTDAALLGLFGLLAADPAGFARDTTAALGAVVNGTMTAVHALIREA